MNTAPKPVAKVQCVNGHPFLMIGGERIRVSQPHKNTRFEIPVVKGCPFPRCTRETIRRDSSE